MQHGYPRSPALLRGAARQSPEAVPPGIVLHDGFSGARLRITARSARALETTRTTQTRLSLAAARLARVLHRDRVLEIEGRRESRVLQRTRSSACKK